MIKQLSPRMWRGINKLCIPWFNLLYLSHTPLLVPLSLLPFCLFCLFCHSTYSCSAISEMSGLDLATGDLNSDSVTEEYSEASVIAYCLYVVTFWWNAKLVKVCACLCQEVWWVKVKQRYKWKYVRGLFCVRSHLLYFHDYQVMWLLLGLDWKVILQKPDWFWTHSTDLIFHQGFRAAEDFGVRYESVLPEHGVGSETLNENRQILSADFKSFFWVSKK